MSQELDLSSMLTDMMSGLSTEEENIKVPRYDEYATLEKNIYHITISLLSQGTIQTGQLRLLELLLPYAYNYKV